MRPSSPNGPTPATTSCPTVRVGQAEAPYVSGLTARQGAGGHASCGHRRASITDYFDGTPARRRPRVTAQRRFRTRRSVSVTIGGPRFSLSHGHPVAICWVDRSCGATLVSRPPTSGRCLARATGSTVARGRARTAPALRTGRPQISDEAPIYATLAKACGIGTPIVALQVGGGAAVDSTQDEGRRKVGLSICMRCARRGEKDIERQLKFIVAVYNGAVVREVREDGGRRGGRQKWRVTEGKGGRKGESGNGERSG